MSEKTAIINRLNRIEGQVRGLSRMVDEEKPCDQILTQLLAVRVALDRTGLELVARYIEQCLPDQATAEDLQQARQGLQRTLELLVRVR